MKRVQAVMERFHDLTGIPPSITDTDGTSLVEVAWQPICKDYHRKHPVTCQRCVQSDTELARGLNSG